MSIRYVLLVFLSVNLISCRYLPHNNYIQDRGTHYLAAKTLPPMRLPPGVVMENVHNDYPVSSSAYSGETKKVSLLPPGL